MRKAFFLLSVIFIVGITSEIRAEDFAGTYDDITFYGDDNIADGVSVYTTSNNLTVSRDDWDTLSDVYIERVGQNAHLGPLLQIGNLATIGDRFRTMEGSWTLMDLFMLSDGRNMAMTFIGQDSSTDISFQGAVWNRQTITVSIDDLVGCWQGIASYGNLNLRNTNTNVGFRGRVDTRAYFFKKTSDTTIALPFEGSSLELQVSGSRAFLANTPVVAPDSSIIHVLEIAFDNNGFSMFHVATESDDLTDVYVGISLGTKLECPCDVNEDGQIGLEEAIRALQVTSGIRPQP